MISKNLYAKYFASVEMFGEHAPRFAPEEDGFVGSFGDPRTRVTFRCGPAITDEALAPLASSMRPLSGMGRLAFQRPGEVVVLHATMPCTIRVAGTRPDAALVEIAGSVASSLELLVR